MRTFRTPTPWLAAALSLALAAPAMAEGDTGAGALELSLTLEEAVRLALRNNRTLLSARHEREIERFSLAVAEDRYRPRANIGASTQTDNRSPGSADLSIGPSLRIPTGGELSVRWSQPLAGGIGRTGNWTLGFSQPLLRGFGIGIDTAPLRIARIREQRNILSYRDGVASTVESVIGAYRAVIRAHRAIAISRESLARARRQLEINRALIRAGQMAAREIVQTEAEVANRELALVTSENSLRAADAALISILDVDDVTRIRPVERTQSVEPVWPELEQSIETALRHRTDYLGARMGAEVAEINLRRTENDGLWDLTLDASVSRGSGEGRDFGASLGLRIPLGDRSAKLAVMSAKNALRGARLQLVELRQSIRIAVRQAVRGVEVGFRRVELARRARVLAEQKLDVEQKKLAQGLTSTFRLTAVEDDLVRAQNGELDATIAYLNALTALDRTLGTTLRTWGIEVEGLESEPGESGHDSAPQAHDGRTLRPKAPGTVVEHGFIATPASEDGRSRFEPSRRLLEASAQALVAPGAKGGAPARGRDGVRHVLLLSLSEFAPVSTIARVAPRSLANPRGVPRATPSGGRRAAPSAPERMLQMSLGSLDIDPARIEPR